jgi:hypothetical protein
MSAEFAAAFLAAQKEFPTIAKTKTADMGNYKYKFADLGDVLDAALPILHRHGIALSQPPVSAAGQVGVSTRLIHESGHIEDCGELLLPAGGTPQNAGSAMTYARRYAACAALGIVADEDDDGRAASRPAETQLSDDELAQRGTNKLKAEALELMGDSDEAKAIFVQALAAVGVEGDVVSLDLHDKVRAALREMAP